MQTFFQTLTKLNGIPRRKLAHRSAIEALAFPTSSIIATNAGHILSAVILCGSFANIGKFPIMSLAEVVNYLIRDHPNAIETKVVYAFMLSSTQFHDSIESITEAISIIEDSMAISSNKDEIFVQIKSSLYTFRGWIKLSNNLVGESVKDFETAIGISSSSFQPLLLLAEAKSTLQKKNKQITLCTEVISILMRYIALFLKIKLTFSDPEMEDLKTMQSNVSNDVTHASNDIVLVCCLLVEMYFRRGPRDGIKVTDMLCGMKIGVELATKFEASMLGHCKREGLELPLEEIASIRKSILNCNSLVLKVESMIKK